MHTDATVDHLQRSIAAFAAELRKADKQLREIPHKGKGARKALGSTNKLSIKGNRNNKSSDLDVTNINPPPILNRNTVKLHSIADYPRSVVRYGSVDSYSTFMVRTASSRTVSLCFLFSIGSSIC